MRKSKRLFAMLLTLIMVISMAMPAMAYDVTVKNPKDLPIVRQLDMYQIFAGTITATDETKTDEYGDSNTNYLKGSQTLSDIKWGSAFEPKGQDGLTPEEIATQKATNVTNMVEALKNGTDYATFADAWNKVYANRMTDAERTAFDALVTAKDTANQIALMLAKFNSNINNSVEDGIDYKEAIKEFADAAVEFGNNPYKTLTPVEDKDNKEYEAKGVDGGYYLIKDADLLDENGNVINESYVHTDYIVQVVGNTVITAKSGSVTLDKKITNSTKTEVGSYSIGDEVKYSLTGTLPAYFNEYETFKYVFTDTMSAGLTYTNKLKVYYQQGKDEPEEIKTGWTPNVTTDATKTELTVTFDDLKAVATALHETFNENTKIIVEYTATLNENAVLGGVGNENSAELTFSNDPNSTGTGTTPSDKVFVFTFELDVTKKDGVTGNPLKGAQFVLYRMNGSNKEYVILVDDDDDDDDSIPNIVDGWTPYKNDEEINGAGLSDEEKAKAKKATILTTPADGKILYKGLDAGTYYLEEITAPEGYNKLAAPIEFTIAATEVEKADGTAADITEFKITVGTETNPGTTPNGTVSMDVINNAGSALPETGGIGTTLFYLIGGAMALFAIVLLITKKRMASEN